jgi:hypothetical protein
MRSLKTGVELFSFTSANEPWWLVPDRRILGIGAEYPDTGTTRNENLEVFSNR